MNIIKVFDWLMTGSIMTSRIFFSSIYRVRNAIKKFIFTVRAIKTRVFRFFLRVWVSWSINTQVIQLHVFMEVYIEEWRIKSDVLHACVLDRRAGHWDKFKPHSTGDWIQSPWSAYLTFESRHAEEKFSLIIFRMKTMDFLGCDKKVSPSALQWLKNLWMSNLASSSEIANHTLETGRIMDW